MEQTEFAALEPEERSPAPKTPGKARAASPAVPTQQATRTNQTAPGQFEVSEDDAERALERELERSRRERKPVSIILADIDHFKNVNDTHGHLFGDEALREMARGLRSKLRIYDGIGRYGGEEFLLVLPNCELAAAVERAKELREMIASQQIVSQGKKVAITLSMGVAASECSGMKEIERLVNRADKALYAAKEKGRNRVECIEAPAKKVGTRRGRKS